MQLWKSYILNFLSNKTKNDHLLKITYSQRHLHFPLPSLLYGLKGKSLPKIPTCAEGDKKEKLNTKHCLRQQRIWFNIFYPKCSYSVQHLIVLRDSNSIESNVFLKKAIYKNHVWLYVFLFYWNIPILMCGNLCLMMKINLKEKSN